MTRCAVCNTPGASECATCHSIAYCSENCRSKDAAVHKLICQEFANLSTTNPKPKDTAFLAISLLPNSKVPKLVWLEGDSYVNLNLAKANVPAQATDRRFFGDYLGGGDPAPRRVKITKHRSPNFSLGHTTAIDSRDNFFNDGSVTNECVVAICNGQHKHRWCGEVIIVSLVGLSSLEKHQNVTAADLHIAYNHLISEGDGIGVNETLTFNGHAVDHHKMDQPWFLGDLISKEVGKTVKGVMISCDYDEKVLRKGKYVEVVIENLLPIFTLKAASMTALMKLPLVMYRDSDGSQSRSRNLTLAPIPSQNMEAWLLNLDFDIDSPTWGKTKEAIWTKENIGNVCVAREDRQDISIQQVEAVVSFCCVHLYAVLVSDEILRDEKLSAKDLSKQRKKLLEEHACKEKFEVFFEQMKAEKIRKGMQAWKDAVSPYSVL